MKYFKVPIKLASLIIVFISVFFLVTESYTETSNILAAYLLILISFYLVYHYRKDTKLFITYFFILYSNYSIAINRYIRVSTDPFLNQISDTLTKGQGIFILLFFISSLIFISKDCNPPEMNGKNSTFVSEKNYNYIIGFLCCLFLIIIFFGATYFKVFGGQLYEYSLIFFILGFYFSGKNKKIRIFLFLIMFIYVFNTFYQGDRVSVLQIIMSYYIMFYSHKANYKKTIPYLIIGIIFLTTISVSREVGSYYSILDVSKILANRMFAMDTAFYAYYASLTFVKVKDIIELNEQIQLFWNYFISIFIGGRMIDSNLAEYTKKIYFHFDGGILPFYFYFWFGWVGLFFPAALISFYTKISSSLKSSSSGFSKCLSVYFSSTVFRWYLYSPTALIRGVILLYIVYTAFHFFDYIIRKKSSKISSLS